MSEEFHTVEQVAQRLNLHPKTVLRYIHDGRLRGTRIGKAYRILRSDLEAFAGADADAKAALPAQVTSVVEIEDISTATSERIAMLLNGVAMAGNSTARPVHISTTYVPSDRTFKIVVIGSPRDTACLLQILDMQLEQRS